MNKPDLSQFPQTPGVYLYKDAAGHIIYVGKARRLRQRLASYFRDESQLPIKTRAMLNNAVSLDILNTETEKEALLLESSLIKKHRPRYNILLKDDKEYLLFRIGTDHPFPRVEVIRHNIKKRQLSKGRYFGPFSSGTSARETWRLIHKYFPLRRCRNTAFANRTRPCLYQHMGQCLGPCVLPVPQAEYNAIINKVIMLLSGRSRELIESLKKDMVTASDNLAYEQAATIRDQIKAIEQTIEHQAVVLAPGTDLDLIGLSENPEGISLGIVFVRDGLLLDGRNFFWPALGVEDTPELIYSFLSQFYLANNAQIPPRIIVPWLPAKVETVQAEEQPAIALAPSTPNAKEATAKHYAPSSTTQQQAPTGSGTCTKEQSFEAQQSQLWWEQLTDLQATLSEQRGGSVTIATPRNQSEDKLVLMAATNGKEAVKTQKSPPLSQLLAAAFHAPTPIERIEAIDISHTSGKQTRAGMVVFHHEEPVPNDFRAYDVDANLSEQNAQQGDDYAAIAAWATRRAKAGEPWADLVLIDGGKGQLAAAEKAFTDAGIHNKFILAGIAKARNEEGRADRRAGNTSDRIFIPGRSNPINITAGSAELLFLQRVRDTVHDFVLGRHRLARSAATMAGELTRIPGVGPKLAKQLFDHFGSLTAMAQSTEEDLAKLPGIGKAKAAMLAKRLHLLVSKT